MSKVPLYQNKNNKSFSPNIRIWLFSVLQLLQLFDKNCCKGAAIFGVPLLWLCTTAVTHIIISGGVVPFLEGLLWHPRLVSPHLAPCEVQHMITQELVTCVNDRPCVVKSHILLEVTPLRRTWQI